MLNRSNLKKDPLEQFSLWFLEANQDPTIKIPDACVLGTIDENNWPTTRVILLKDFSKDGFVFYTNYNSKKASALLKQNQASLLFHWESLGYQIRILGLVEKVNYKKSNSYFQSRDRSAQVGAYASKQSQPLESREALIKRFHKKEKQFADQQEIPCPDFWGGYLLKPQWFEFWQDGEHRLHDRFIYSLDQNQNWQIQRVYP